MKQNARGGSVDARHSKIKPAKAQPRLRLSRHMAPYVFLAPYFILFVVFGLFPIVFSIYLSFHQWNPVEGLSAIKFVGFDNFQMALTDPWLWTSLKNTIVIGIEAGVTQHLVAIPAACFLVSLSDRLRHWLMSAYFMPYITSSVAVSLIFFNLYSPTVGVINQTLIKLAEWPWLSPALHWLMKYMPINWLEDVRLIKPAIAFVIFWKFTGFNIVIYATGLMTIPKDLYEAARMDGAGPLRRFWHISLPMLRPFIFFAVTLTLIGQLQLFEEPYVLTRGGGGPSQSALTITAYLMRIGWEWFDMGSACAVAWLLFAFISVVTGLKFLLLGRQGLHYEP